MLLKFIKNIVYHLFCILSFRVSTLFHYNFYKKCAIAQCIKMLAAKHDTWVWSPETNLWKERIYSLQCFSDLHIVPWLMHTYIYRQGEKDTYLWKISKYEVIKIRKNSLWFLIIYKYFLCIFEIVEENNVSSFFLYIINKILVSYGI